MRSLRFVFAFTVSAKKLTVTDDGATAKSKKVIGLIPEACLLACIYISCEKPFNWLVTNKYV